MNDIIILEKARDKKTRLVVGILYTSRLAELAQALSFVNLAEKYKWAMKDMNLDTAKEL